MDPMEVVGGQDSYPDGLHLAAHMMGPLLASPDMVQPGQNVLVSPFSISLALSLALEGARGNTAAEMARVLGLSSEIDGERLHQFLVSLLATVHSPPPPNGQTMEGLIWLICPQMAQTRGLTLDVATGLWPASRFVLEPDFVGKAHQLGAEARSLDYIMDAEGSRQVINAWVEGKTHNKIIELIPEG